jgi:N6-adenosine-specific RNA methylase IME4
MAARVLCADPPWKFGDALPGPGRGATKHYPCMTVADLCAFPLPPLDDDAHLFLWRVASMQQEALDVAKAWGFTVKSEIVWKKITVNGKRHFGMGRQVRMEHEVALICTRGKPKVRDHAMRSIFEAPVGRHSEKPEIFYRDVVERLCAGPYVELFARRERPGWACFGNELAAAA